MEITDVDRDILNTQTPVPTATRSITPTKFTRKSNLSNLTNLSKIDEKKTRKTKTKTRTARFTLNKSHNGTPLTSKRTKLQSNRKPIEQ